MGWSGPIPYLNTFAQEVHDINHKVIDERKLYGEVWGKARAALMVAVRKNDYNFITMLDKYLNNCQSDSDESSDSEIESESNSKTTLDPSELMNPNKRKKKGCLKGTDRIRRADEPSKKAKRQLHCKICGGLGHNRVTCSQRQK
ncbi:hypothetical protein C2G38_2042345 [Gigaspora rosea]|uniref:Uncharacterized protein n=1 Tax=Gigaspora rosea TaxID=44941 RepID=A0A397URK6_9GLOM|nr:hypothetical protein C2G38_2042345 [Gigaspora rosea]